MPTSSARTTAPSPASVRQATSDFITKTLSKITLIGAVFLAIVAGFPIILGNITGTSIQLGGTTLLIVVGVALETGRSLEAI